MSTIYLGSWTNLDIFTLTNLFLYGQTEKPVNYCDRIRPADAEEIHVQLDMFSFMTSGPGRYAVASSASFVQTFFSNLHFGSAELSPALSAYLQTQQGPVTLTAAELRTLGYTDTDFRFSFQQRALDTTSEDYAARTYIYNSEAFEITTGSGATRSNVRSVRAARS